MIICHGQIHAQIDTIINPIKADTLFQVRDSLAPLKDSFKLDSSIKLEPLGGFKLKPNAKVITGIASFYSKNLDGTKTATGEYYRNAKLTAASNNYKLNTWGKSY